MYCMNCGKFCVDNQTFCLGCGLPLQSNGNNQTLDFDIKNYTDSSKFGESNPNINNLNNNQNINNQNINNQNINNNQIINTQNNIQNDNFNL